MREPWASVFRALVRFYVGLGMLIAIVAFRQLELVADTGSLDRCLARLDLSADARTPLLIGYLAYKGALWPLSLGWSVADGTARPVDWALGRYDPFAGC